MTFTIICNECEQKITLADNEDTKNHPIKVSGEPEALFEASVYINCECGNSIEIWRTI